MGTEGVPRTLELSRKCQGISLCLGSGHPADICFADISNEVTAAEMALKLSQHPSSFCLTMYNSTRLQIIANTVGKQEAQLSLRDRATRACQLKSGKVLHKCRRLVFEKL